MGNAMTADAAWLYSGGISTTGFTFGVSSGADPDPQRVEAASRILGRAARLVDDHGYQREMFAAAIDEQAGVVAYVESRAKQLSGRVEIAIHLHVQASDGRKVAWEIVSYNPFFGCHVRFLEWFGKTVIMIYREKHRTYVCRFGLNFAAVCKEIGDYWVMKDGVLASRRDKNETLVRRLSIPELSDLPEVSQQAAEMASMFPATASQLPTRFWQNSSRKSCSPMKCGSDFREQPLS
jgi:hypothetical protein